jgi:hypothetical protein
MGNFIRTTILGFIIMIALAVAYFLADFLLGALISIFPADGSMGIVALVLSWVITAFVTGFVILMVIRRFH